MYNEYLIDPEQFESFIEAKAILDVCGWAKGRVILEYPKRWRKMLYDSVYEKSKDREKKCLEEILRRKQLFCKRKAHEDKGGYNSEESWISNAKNEHQRMPVKAIIAKVEGINCFHPNYTLEHSEHWASSNGLINRTENDILFAISFLLMNSSIIKIIDPFFDDKQLLQKIFDVINNSAYKTNMERKVELHFKIVNDAENKSLKSRTSYLKNKFDNFKTYGIEFEIFLWNEETSKRIHNRYILSDLSGLQFGDSIAASPNLGEKDRVSILNDNDLKALTNDFSETSSVNKMVFNFKI